MDKINPSDVGERINDTKKEISQLNEELERLIKSNTGLSNINFDRGNFYGENKDITKSKETEDKDISNSVVIPAIGSSIKKGNALSKTSILPDVKSKMKSDLTSKKKNMRHDKEVTRAFMRQQREKREEQRKKTDSKSKIDQELKKQKLLELQQKSLALVQKNLQLKRERSKSTERKQQIRIDKTNFFSNCRNSDSKEPPTGPIPIKKAASEIKSFKGTIKSNEKSINTSTKINQKKFEQSYISKKPRNFTDKGFSSLGNESISHTLLLNDDLSKTDKDIAARKIQNFYRDYRTKKQIETRKTLLEEQEKENPVKESKETQTLTLEQINFPTWLQPPTVDPYPCNFINTIKKKLQLVVSSPVRCKDVGIQSSIIETEPKIQQLYKTHRNISKETLRSDKTIDSHSQKTANLDANALQHFALTQFREKYSLMNKQQSKSDSECDTSKNIPEISTESGLVSDEKLMPARGKSDDFLSINTDKIKNLTLRNQISEDFSNAHENISKKSCTFNFSEEDELKHTHVSLEKIQSDEIISKQYIRSPRDSIISFNISCDDDMPSIVSQKSKQFPQSITSEEIKTEKFNISSETENSRRKLIFPSKESIPLHKAVDNDEYCNRSGVENMDLSKYNPKTASYQVLNSLLTSPVSKFSQDNRNSSHTSSPSSKHNVKLNNSPKKDHSKTSDIETRSPNFQNIDKNSDKRLQYKYGDSADTIIAESTSSTTSIKLSNPSDLVFSPLVKQENEKYHSEMKTQSLPKSIASNKSKTSYSIDNSITDSSIADFSKLTSKMSEYHKEIINDKEMISSLNDAYNENIVEKPEIGKSSISNIGSSNEKEINYHEVKDVKRRVAQSKAFESLKNKTESSFRNSSKTSSAITFSSDDKISSNLSKNIYSTINMSRGSDIDESYGVDEILLKTHSKSSNILDMSNMQKNAFEHNTFSFNENIPNNLAGLSIKMFEQFIKDEDIRIENLKTIIKIREQALLDRTKGELAWLEIQRKHLKETGKLHEASLVKKKQRGILLKHQQERREMQRLKQLQKIQSNERKIILKEQKNLIKAKLTSEKLMSELKIQTPRKQRLSGPMRVLKASESHSETSLSRRASDAEEIFSITSRSRSIKLSEIDSSRELVLKQEDVDVKSISDNEDIDKMKRALLVRQASLMKRRKAVEDLLKRHQKLLEEEKKIKELEMAANAIIMQLPSSTSKSVINREPRIKNHLKDKNSKDITFTSNESLQEKYLLDPLGKSTDKENLSEQIVGNEISKPNVSMSEYSFKSFYKNAKTTINNMKVQKNLKDQIVNQSSSQIQNESSMEYSEDFESELQLLETESTENNLSSISELIEDFTQIEYGISMFSKQFNENTKVTSGTLEKLSETTSPSSQDTQKNLNISSWPNGPMALPEKSGFSLMHNENTKSDTDTLSSINDEQIYITQDKHNTVNRSSNISEKQYFRSEQYPSPLLNGEKVGSENISSELPEHSAVLTEEYNVKSSSSELLPSESQQEILVESDNISSELELLRIITSTDEITEKNVNMFKIDENITKESLNSEIISILDKSLRSNSEIEEVTENIASERIALNNNENNSLTENAKLMLEQNKNKFIGEAIEDKGTKSPEMNIFDKNVLISITNIKKENEESDIQNISEILEENTKSTLVKLLSQKLSAENSSRAEGSMELPNEKPYEKTASQNVSEELSSITLKEEIIEDIITDKLSKSFDNKLKKDIMGIQSLEKEGTYQNIPSIEINSELYDSEIKTDDTTNKDISELDDDSEIIWQKKNNELRYEVQGFMGKKKSIDSIIIDTSINGQKKGSRSDDKKSFNFSQEISEDDVKGNNSEINKSLSREIENENNGFLDGDIESVSLHNKKETKYENLSEVSNEDNDIISELTFADPSEEKLLDESHVISTLQDVENSNKVNSFSNSYTDDFDEDKEDNLVIKETSYSVEKSTLDLSLEIQGNEKSIVKDENEVLMVKIDLTMDPSKNEANIIVIKENSNVIPNHDEKLNPDELNQENTLKSSVHQRVSEILAKTVGSQRSPRNKNTCRDYYVTTYEDITPDNSPEAASPVKSNQFASINTFNNEAEELMKKQLAIEMEIKHLEQQQKDQLPFVYMREIPNKPPPPYTPPSTQSNVITILPPSALDVKEICRYSAKVLYNAYLSNNLHAVTFSETHFKAINKTKSTKECCSFVFDLCKETAANHYKYFQTKKKPSWLKLPDKVCLIPIKPFTYHELENHIHIKVRELLGLKKTNIQENSVIRWSRKKKDHVDEILVLESQTEEKDWLNYDNDELMVKNDITDAIFDILLSETIEIYRDIFS